MDMDVFFGVDVFVTMSFTVAVKVNMFMWPISDGPSNSPDGVCKPEYDKRPNSDVTSKGFKKLKTTNCNTKCDTQKSKDN
jgi:hypothetical protein